MAEEWLDGATLQRLQKKPAMLDTDSDVEFDPEPIRQKLDYDDRKRSITLPVTQKIEQLEYVPPELDFSAGQMNAASSAEPHFKLPEDRFDVFEHFQFEWIEIPELEADSS